MLLGKRPRPPMRKTTSMSGIVPPSGITDGQDPQSDEAKLARALIIEEHSHEVVNLVPMASPRNGYGSRAAAGGAFGVGYDCDAGNPETAHFLETCGLCKRRLFPGQDIYMYRGDTAFCAKSGSHLESWSSTRSPPSTGSGSGGYSGSSSSESEAGPSTRSRAGSGYFGARSEAGSPAGSCAGSRAGLGCGK